MFSKLCAVLCILLSLSTLDAAGASVRDTISNNYAKISGAFENNNMPGIAKFLTTGFVSVQQDGKRISRRQILTDLTRQRDLLSSVTWDRTIEAFSMRNGEAIVTVAGKMVGTRDDANGGTHTFQFAAESRDTWTLVGSSWKLRRSEPIAANMTVDGVPLQNVPKKQ